MRGKKIRGIGGSCDSIGDAEIQIPSRNFGILIELKFLHLTENLPTLLSMKEMLQNELDLSNQENTCLIKTDVNHYKW